MMSESTSSPSVHVHPISPSSSLSSTDSAPASEPTSDEQPDLGAFTTVLREWTHLQPPPRIPVQIHSATSSTTSTYHAEQSLVGSDRGRLGSRSGLSTLSSFTRPPSSSLHPDGSTVWAHPPIASYLFSATPSNDIEESTTPSPPESHGSALTVEIASEVDFPSFDDGSRDDRSQDTESAIPILVASDSQRVDSRETEHDAAEIDSRRDDSTGVAQELTTTSQSNTSLASVQLQSQARPITTTVPSSSSSSSSSDPNVSISIAGPSSVGSHINSAIGASGTTGSTSTLMTALLNRSRNPIPPRTMSDSSYTNTGSASSSSFSLVSYQLPETPSVAVVHEDSDVERTLSSQLPAQHTNTSTSALSASLSLKTQRSLLSSGSTATAPHRTRPSHALNSSVSSTGSPLQNLHSLPTQERDHHRHLSLGLQNMDVKGFGVVDDLGTPDQPPSETVLFSLLPPKRGFQPIVDDQDDESQRDHDSSSRYVPTNDLQRHSDPNPYDELDDHDYSHNYPYSHSHSHTPRYPFAHTPRGVPATSHKPRASTSTQTQLATTSNPVSFLEQQFGLNLDQPSTSQPQTSANLSSSTHPVPLDQRLPSFHSLGQLPTSPPSPVLQPILIEADSNDLSRTHTLEPTSISRTQPQFSSQTHVLPPPSAAPLQMPHVSQQTQTRSRPPIFPAASAPVSTHAHQSQVHLHPDSIYSGSSFNTSSLDIRSQPAPGRVYPHSLAGLHLLPTEPPRSFVVSDLTPSSSETSSIHGRGQDSEPSAGRSQAPVDPEAAKYLTSTAGKGQLPLNAEESTNADDAEGLPSLGFLDEALSFIAAERAKWNAAREGSGMGASSSTTNAVNGNGTGAGDSEAEEEAEERKGDEGWRNGNDGDKGTDQPKRKRRRKRPAKRSASSGVEVPLITPPPTVTSNALTMESSAARTSPKKRRSKSAAPSMTLSTSGSTRSERLGTGTMTPGRNKGKEKEKEFLIPAPILAPSTSGQSKFDANVDSDVEDGGRTPTNAMAVAGEAGGILGNGSSTVTQLNLIGKKGKRVGRREREREKLKFDTLKSQDETGGNSGSAGGEFEIGVQYGDGDNDNDDDEELEPREVDEEEEDAKAENDSISNMSLLQPPRRRRSRSRKRRARDTVHVHTLAGITGVYKSTPATPNGVYTFDGQVGGENDRDRDGVEEGVPVDIADEEEDVFASKPNASTSSEKDKKKRARPKRTKTLVRVRSFPSLRLEAEAQNDGAESVKSKKSGNSERGEEVLEMDRSQASSSQKKLETQAFEPPLPPPSSKRSRLLTLAKNLQQLFPEQREELGRVITRIEKQDVTPTPAKVKKAVVSADAVGSEGAGVTFITPDLKVASSKRKRPKKGGHVRAASEGTIMEGPEVDDDGGAEEQDKRHITDVEEEEEEEIDPRGRPPRKKDPLVHVFIDHSNILIGLLSHLKRSTPYRKSIYIARRKPIPALLTRATTISGPTARPDPAFAFAAVKSTSARPLPILPAASGSDGSPKSQIDADGQGTTHPIPLPSFATISRSLPSGSVLSASMAVKHSRHSSEEFENQRAANSDGYDYSGVEDGDSAGVGDSSFQRALKFQREKRRPLKHLWHAALTLVLERGRPVTRRVVVASSPLYQPMETIEHLGYELRVFIRVPDFGDGMDRERHRDKGTPRTGTPGKSTQSSPVKPVKMGHIRRISGSPSAESGREGNTAGNGSLHPYYGITNASTPQTKVKYREQGVDELLQLKLHQAIAATDDVPDGSTIVLATGDGNMGQFNEEGFLGPIRTALRRGWKVELYAWEDGLSRSWRREFGESTEWGRRGMFRIIGMEQFASWLVKDSDWA